MGKNGAGKSTMLKILSGDITPDSGVIATEKEVKIGFLRQDIDFVKGRTVLEEAYQAFEEIKRVEFKIEEINRRKPGAIHHIAFRAKDIEEVIEIANKLKSANINIVDGPAYFPQHGEKYFAVYFKDNNGIKFEVMFEIK